MSRWLFDVELLLRLQRLGGGADGGVWFEQPLHRWSEKPGSKIKPGDYWRALADLHRLERLYADRASAECVEQDGLMQPLRPIVVIAPFNAIAKRRAA
jgi:hypothetical protein